LFTPGSRITVWYSARLVLDCDFWPCTIGTPRLDCDFWPCTNEECGTFTYYTPYIYNRVHFFNITIKTLQLHPLLFLDPYRFLVTYQTPSRVVLILITCTCSQFHFIPRSQLSMTLCSGGSRNIEKGFGFPKEMDDSRSQIFNFANVSL
jgi:hypothetical protein